jgi:hypothetical protein
MVRGNQNGLGELNGECKYIIDAAGKLLTILLETGTFEGSL